MGFGMKINGESNFASEASKLGNRARDNPTPENLWTYLIFTSEVGPHFHPHGGPKGFLETALDQADAGIAAHGKINGEGEKIRGKLEILADIARAYSLTDRLQRYNAMLDGIYAAALKSGAEL